MQILMNFLVDAYDITPETTLNTYLRDKAHLTGTKRTCLEGGCGACIVAVEHTDPITKTKRFFSINSVIICLIVIKRYNKILTFSVWCRYFLAMVGKSILLRALEVR